MISSILSAPRSRWPDARRSRRAQQAAPPLTLQEAGTSTFTGVPARRADRHRAGRGDATADGWTIASTGRLGAPLDIVGAPAAGALHRRLEAARPHDRRDRRGPVADASTRRSTARPRRTTSRSPGSADNQDRHHRAGASGPAERVLRPVRGAGRAAETAPPGTTIPVYILPQASLSLTRRRSVDRADSDRRRD